MRPEASQVGETPYSRALLATEVVHMGLFILRRLGVMVLTALSLTFVVFYLTNLQGFDPLDPQI